MFSNNYTVTSYLLVIRIIISLSFVLLHRSMCLPCSDFTENMEMNIWQKCGLKSSEGKAVLTAAHPTVVLNLLQHKNLPFPVYNRHALIIVTENYNLSKIYRI
jgi:hypothetical protein